MDPATGRPARQSRQAEYLAGAAGLGAGAALRIARRRFASFAVRRQRAFGAGCGAGRAAADGGAGRSQADLLADKW